MASIKLAPLLTEIRGSVGSLTFQRNKFGITLRQKPITRNQCTPAQQKIKVWVKYIQAAWIALTDAQRKQWGDYINYSQASQLRSNNILVSGYNLYLKYQLFRLMAGISLLSTIAYTPLTGMPNFSEFCIVSDQLYIVFDEQVDSSKHFFILFCSSPRRSSQRFSHKGLRWMYIEPQVSQDMFFHDSYISAFGVLPAVNDILHYTLQWFSIVAPIWTSKITGTFQIVSC
jgi:hypothetical protein